MNRMPTHLNSSLDLIRGTIESYEFNLVDWRYIRSKSELIDELRDFKQEFKIALWTEEVIRIFLQLRHWLYPDSSYYLRHVRTIYTILSEVDL